MIITGRTINQLPILSSITSAATLILQTGNTTFRANLLEFTKSAVFGSQQQDLIPVSSNTFSLGSTGSTIKTLYVTSGSVIIGQSGLIGIDSSGNTYSTSGISTPSLFIGNVTSEGVKSSGVSITIVSGDTIIVNQSGESINLFKQIVPTGGTTSQVLAKDSGSNYDYSWQNLQGLYITGATSNGGGLDIYQSATTSTLAFKTITSLTPTHITIADTGGLLRVSGTGILSISNNGAGAFIAQSGTSSTVSLRSLSSQTPTNLSINASGNLILFSSKTFYDSASNGSGGGQQVLQTSTIPNLVFRTLSSSTSDKLNITTSGGLLIFSAKTDTLFSAGTGNILLISSITSSNDVIQKSINQGTNISISDSGSGTITFNVPQFITGATNNGGGTQVYQSGTSSTLAFRTLSSSTPTNLSLTTSDGLVILSSKTFYDSASNSGSGQQILATNTIPSMTFRTLSSSTPTNLRITTSGNEIVFSSKTFITGATNSDNGGIGIFKSADTQTLTFRTLSSTSESLLVVANGDGLITFTPRQKYHGEFSSLLTQSATSANTMYVMSAETTDISQGITVVNGSRFTVISSGTYNIQFSAQLERVGNGSSTVDIWFRKSGNNIARSNSQITLTKNSNDKLVASWNLLDTLTAGQYFEIAWSSSDTGNLLRAQGTQTNPTRPEIPSVIVTVFEV